ncbi:RHS repeat-associated core domain-containing protein [Pseudomonas serbica]|jgi:RHS repeat-associated protein|uniref:RHS repeat-associated core domain-containing protein n=1 Tax=Pseudomonas serbica TaxID=2965074 RepID=UPI0039E2FB59
MPTSSRKTILLATDQQQSVLNALDTTQNHPLAYSPYGHRPPGNGLLSLLGFNGELPDSVTGHYHLGKGYRQFNPVLMRFNSPDSWSPFGSGGINAYAYCNGEPVLGTDPTGHSNIFMSAWKGFKNTFFGRIPKRQRTPTPVATPTAATSQTSINPHHPKNASTFDFDNLSEAKKQPNRQIQGRKNFPPQPEASAKSSAIAANEKPTKAKLKLKLNQSEPTSHIQHNNLLATTQNEYIKSAPLEKLIAGYYELSKNMERPGPSRQIQELSALENEIIRRTNKQI